MVFPTGYFVRLINPDFGKFTIKSYGPWSTQLVGRMGVDVLLKEPGEISETQSCLSTACGRTTHKNKIQRNLVGSMKETEIQAVSMGAFRDTPNAVTVGGRQG